MSMTEEAEALKKRFDSVENRAAFAREYRLPGGAAMIYQHINAIKPISLEAAICYARAFRCSLEDISRDKAKEIAEAAKMLRDSKSIEVREPVKVYQVYPPSTQELIDLASNMTEDLRNQLIGMAKALAMTASTSNQNSIKRAG